MPSQVARSAFGLGAYFVGVAGAGLFLAYILGIGTGLWPRGDAEPGLFPWLNNLGWLLLFATHHSCMARQSYKQWSRTRISRALERSLYVAISGLLLGAMTLWWQPLPGEPIWHGPSWLMLVSILGALGVGYCCSAFDHLTFFGLRQALMGKEETQGPLCVSGPYRYVRHPLMLGLLVALWAQPIMQPELLLMNVGLTVYILIAIRLEERDLVRQFGDDYKTYRRKVPALLPFSIR